MIWLGILIGLVVGGPMGFFLSALFSVGREKDD